MSDGRILTYRAQVVTDLKAAFPLIKDIDTHSGRFDDEDITRLIMTAPALRIAYLGSPRAEERLEGRLRPNAKFGCFVVTRDSVQSKRDAQAINIGEALMVLFDRYAPLKDGKSLAQPAENVRHDILYTSAVDKKGVLLTAVSWDVRITIGDSIFSESGAVLEKLYVNDDLLLDLGSAA